MKEDHRVTAPLGEGTFLPEEGRGGREKERERETPKGEQVSRLTSPPLTREGQREGEKRQARPVGTQTSRWDRREWDERW